MKASYLLLLLLLALPAQAQTSRSLEERQLEAKLERQLEAILGPGKARVTVTGKQESPSQTRSTRRSNPQIVGQRQSSQKETQSRTGSEARDTETRTTQKTQSETSWTYDQTEELRSNKPSELSQKSVSIIYEPPAQGEDEEARPALDTREIELMARAAAGIDESQGDRLHVAAARMDTSAYDRLKAEMEKAAQGTPWWVFAAIGAAGVGLGAGAGAVLMRRRNRAQAPQPEWQAPPVWTPAEPVQNVALPQGHVLGAGPQGPVVHIQPHREA